MTHLPIPPDAVVGDWHPSEYSEDVFRTLTWSRHDTAAAVVAVEGAQYADGRIERHVVVSPEGAGLELVAADARRLAAALLDAADVMDGLR